MTFGTQLGPNAQPDIYGPSRVSQKDLTLDANYTTGGYAFTAANMDLAFIRQSVSVQIVTPTAAVVVSGVVLPQTDGSAKLKLNVAAAELGAGVGTGLVARVTVAGY